MSTIAAARVETRIILSGEGNAAKTVADTRKELDGLAGDAKKASAATQSVGAGLGDVAKSATGVVQRSGGAFAGLASVLGGAVVPEIAKVGQSLTAAGAAANILPGPIGLAAAGVAALALGAFELQKHFAQTAAKIRELGDSSTRGLADSLGVSVDEAIKLQQAMADLPATIRPTPALLEVVRQRAEAIGKEGGAAVLALTEALGKGPAAVQAFEREFGRLSQVSAKLPDVSARLGLSQAALGIAKEAANEVERAKVAAERAVVLDRERAALLSAAVEIEARASAATVAKSLELGKQADSLRRQASTYDELVAAATAEANALQAVVDRQREAEALAARRSQVANVLAAEIGVFEAQASAQLDKQAGLRLTLHASQLRQAENSRRQVELTADHNRGLVKELDFRAKIAGLQSEGFRLAAAELAIGKQAAAEAKARADRGRQAAQAETAAQIRLAKVEADRLDASAASPGATAARLRQLDLEESAEVAKARREVNTARGREVAVAAIRQEFAAKREALDRAVADNEARLAQENRALLDAGLQRSADLAAKVADTVTAAAQKRSASLAASLRAAGANERADLVERKQAWADYGAEVDKVDKDFAAAQAKTKEGSQDRANAETLALAQSEAAWEAYNERIGQLDREARARLRENIAAVSEAIKAPAELLASSGGPGAKLFKALAATADGVSKVSRGWKEAGGNAPAVIGAVGQVAAAFVEGERQKAAILAITEAAAAVASYPNVPAMVAHGAAAVLYGAAAAGAIGGSGGGGAPSIPAAGDLVDRASPAGGAAGAGATGGGNVVNVYFGRGFVVGTPQQVGVAVQGAMGSLKGSGLKAKGV
ncbi:MAG: hypothetical protein FJ191_12695 [Gammaproteobacteria bacterium]|nr:hypothetical protein [Gammaproteobacteria bacterium]